MSQFPAPLTTLIARFLTFVVSSASAILLLLSMCNEGFLWYLALYAPAGLEAPTRPPPQPPTPQPPTP